MITPFGRPTLFVVSQHEPVVQALSQFFKLFFDSEYIQHHLFPEENAIRLNCIDDLHTRLDRLERREIFNTICVFDLTISKTTNWNVYKREDVPRPTELVLRYPEIYWIFIVKEIPVDDMDLHFITMDTLPDVLPLLKRHSNGFRTCFDPNGFRSYLRRLSPEVQAKFADNHSAPYLNQTIASALIKRAQKIKETASTPEEGLHAALLALEAWILLRRKTFILSLYALDILHQMEVFVECIFIGATSHFPVDKRFKELEEQVDTLNPHNGVASDFPVLQQAHIIRTAAAIDEEESFVLLHGYIFYKYGFSTYLIPSLGEMKAVFGFKDESTPTAEIESIMEDIELRFGDAIGTNDEECLKLDIENFESEKNKRCDNFPGMAKVELRVFISSKDANSEIQKKYNYIVKPHSGIFNNKLSKLLKNYRKTKLEVKYSDKSNLIWSHQKYGVLVAIAEDLRKTYRDYGQLEEEEKALVKVRNYRWKLNNPDVIFSKTLAGKITNFGFIKKFCIAPVEHYFNWLMESIQNTVYSIIFWILYFSILFNPFYWEAASYSNITIFISMFKAVINSASVFIALQPLPVVPEPSFGSYAMYWIIVVFEMFLGFAHLGIFIACLYQKIARK